MDESINDNNGTVYGATLTEDHLGNADNAYHFDGIDDYIELMNESEKITELPVIPPLPRYKRKPKKPLTKKEKITIDEMSRTITNKLGDIKSILG